MKFMGFVFALCAILCVGCDEVPLTREQAVDMVRADEVAVPIPVEVFLADDVAPPVTAPPPEVLTAMKRWAELEMRRMHERYAGEHPFDTPERTAEIRAEIDRQMKVLGTTFEDYDMHAHQREYYTKFVDAAGIGIVTNYEVWDAELLQARDAVLVMTAKHPALREKLLLKHEVFYLILLRARGWVVNGDGYESLVERDVGTRFEGYWELPETTRMPFPTCVVVTPYYGDPPRPRLGGWQGFCYAPLMARRIDAKQAAGEPPMQFSIGTKMFVHEFAHALEWEMERLEPGFSEKQQAAYDRAVAMKKPLRENAREHWAAGVEIWFFGIHPEVETPVHKIFFPVYETYEAFFEDYPLLGEMLDYWFPRVSLLVKGAWEPENTYLF